MSEIKQTITMLANGPASYILREMKTSVSDIDQVCGLFPSKKHIFEPEAALSKSEINRIIGAAQPYVIPLEHADRDVRSMEAKPGIKRYMALQKQIEDNTTSSYQLAALQRESNGLKAAFSRELVNLVKKSHESLSLRLHMITGWKDVVEEEIAFMEEIQIEVFTRLMNDAHREGLKEIVLQLQERLSILNRNAVVETTRVRPTVLTFGGIKTLQVTLKKQLQDAVQLELMMMKKFDVLEELSAIESRITNDLPNDAVFAMQYRDFPSTKASGIRPQEQFANRMANGRLQTRTA